MKHVFIVGSRGYHANYGGWETFVSKLVDHYNDKNTIFHISMITDDKNLKEYKIGNNIIINPIFVKSTSSAKMFFYSIKAFKYYLKYIEKNNFHGCYIYVLGLKLFNYLSLKRRKIKKLNVNVFVNPDGLEWMRSKWSYPIKKFFLLSEKLMLNNCDLIVCDGLGIENYIHKKYPNLKDKTVYIAYGYEKFELNKSNYGSVLRQYNLEPNNYFLMVGRCVPENNYEFVIKEFMESNIPMKLVIVSNISSTNYYTDILSKTNCNSDKRIVFIDGIYDGEKLAIIRKNAYAYIHGHSVGGTNPSLIEAMSLTDLNILYDVCFNHDIGLDTCLYFKESGSLCNLLNNKKMLDKAKKDLSRKVKKRVKDNFTWDIIVNKYKKIFK